MNGLLSNRPSPMAARLAMAAILLLLIQVVLVLGGAELAGALRTIVLLTALLALASLIAAIRGETRSERWGDAWRTARFGRRRDGR